LLTYTATAAAVFGVYFRLQGIVFMPIFGLNNGMIPIVSYNYGARNKKRLIHAIKLSMTYAIVIMVIGFVMFQIFPAQLLSLYNATADMIAIGVPAFRIISISFLFAGFCIISGSVFQALGNGIPSMITSTSRQLIALIPLALLLSRIGGLNAIWWAFPLSEILAVVITAFFLKYFYNNKIKVLG
ncbi:MAG: MATE family efflux transporter, partial [Clostridiales bacterium]|nr:MATE family efflux transporter [Clostridiales bacterium]